MAKPINQGQATQAEWDELGQRFPGVRERMVAEGSLIAPGGSPSSSAGSAFGGNNLSTYMPPSGPGPYNPGSAFSAGPSSFSQPFATAAPQGTDERDAAQSAFKKLNEYADDFPHKMKEIGGAADQLTGALKKFETSLADTSGSQAEQELRKKQAAQFLTEKIAKANESPVKEPGALLAESFSGMLPGLLKGLITGAAYKFGGPIAGVMAYQTAGPMVEHLERGGPEEKGGIAAMLGKVGGWLGMGKAAPTVTAAPAGDASTSVATTMGEAGGAGAGLAAAAGPVGIALAAASMVNGALNKLGDGLAAANQSVIGFTTGMAESLGVPRSIAELGGAVMNLFSPLRIAGDGLKLMQLGLMPLMNLDKPGELLKSTFSAVADVGKALVTVLWDMRDPVQMLTAAVSPFINQVNKFNPGIVERMNLSFDNLSAAAGRMFEPIIVAATDFADNLNVLFTRLAGPLRPIISSISASLKDMALEFAVGFAGMIQDSLPVIKGMIDDLRSMGPIIRDFGKFMIWTAGRVMWAAGKAATVLAALEPAIKPLAVTALVIAAGFTILAAATTLVALAVFPLAAPLLALGLAVTAVAITFGKVGDWLREKFPDGFTGGVIAGIFGGGSAPAAPTPAPTGPMTPAAQQARHVGIEDVGLQFREKAFSMGTDDPQTQTAGNTAAMLTILRDLAQGLGITLGNLPALLNPPQPAN